MRIIVLHFIIFSITLQCFSQATESYYIPVKLSYFPGYKFRIPWEEKLDNDTWIRMLNYPLTNPREANALYSKDKEAYNKRANKVLYPRTQCDSLIKSYVYRVTTKVSDMKPSGAGAYYAQEKSGDRLYFRCVCIPATELINIPHQEAYRLGDIIKYFEPEDFVKKFKRYKLDSLDLNEVPYYTIFPMDINPSFDCSKATTPIEKAICRNSELANLDKELMQLYKYRLKINGESIREAQRKWLIERERKCQSKDNEIVTNILREMYQKRIRELKN